MEVCDLVLGEAYLYDGRVVIFEGADGPVTVFVRPADRLGTSFTFIPDRSRFALRVSASSLSPIVLPVSSDGMLARDLKIGETYGYGKLEVVLESLDAYNVGEVHVKWKHKSWLPTFRVAVDQLKPLERGQVRPESSTRFDRMGGSEEVFKVTSEVCVDPFEFPVGAVGIRDGETYTVYATARGDFGEVLGEFASESEARDCAGAYVDHVGSPRGASEGYVILREGGEGQDELASLLSVRLFGEVYTGMGKVRLNLKGELGALAVERFAWLSLPEAQREGILRFLVGFSSGFEYGKQAGEG